MIEFASNYWGIATWVIATIFAVGVMWQKVEMSMRATRKLFEVTDELQKFVAGQAIENTSFRDSIVRIEQERTQHQEDAGKRYASLVIRVDQIYEILTRKK